MQIVTLEHGSLRDLRDPKVASASADMVLDV